MSSSGKKTKNWKGQDQVQVNTPLHQWEVGARETSKTQVAIPTQGLGFATVFLGCASLVVLCAFIYFLLHSPKKTPLIVVAPTSYSWPYIPSSWRAEDAKGLQFLSKKTLEVVNRSKVWMNRNAALEDLSEQLGELSSAAKESGTVILYLAMAPCVDDDSEPCLIPPEANPLEPEQWIRLKEIVDVVHKQSPTSTRKLIVIDPIQLTSNWHLGILRGTFVDRLESWLQEQDCPEIAILTAASDREIAWSGADIRSSIFGREFRLGISGEADKVRSGQVSGDGDGIVTVNELTTYLQAKVTDWVSTRRGVKQTPRLFAKDKSNFPLASTLSSYEQGRQRAELATAGVAEPSMTTSEMVEIWTMMDKLREVEPYRYDPYGWAQLERRVVELGVLSRSGSAYSEQCKRLLSVSLQKRLTELSEAATKTAKSNCLLDRYGLFNPSLRGQFPAAAMPSLALKELIGELDGEKALMARTQVRQLLGQPGPANLESLGASFGLTPNASNWNEANFVTLLNAFECTQAWQDTSVIQQLLDLRENWEKVVSQGDIRSHRWSRSLFEIGDQARRAAEDSLFAGESQEARDAVAAFAKIVESLSTDESNEKVQLEKMVHVLDRAYSISIPTAHWIMQTASIGDETVLQEQLTVESDLAQDWSSTSGDLAETASSRIKRRLMERFSEFAENIRNLNRLLIDAQTNPATLIAKGRESSTRLEADIDYLTTAIHDEVSRLTSERTSPENAIPRLERLLEIPFLQADQLQAINDKLLRLYQNDGKNSNAATELRLTDSNKLPSANANTVGNSSDVLDEIKALSLHPVQLMLELNRNGVPSESGETKTGPMSRADGLKTLDRFNAELRRRLRAADVLDASRISDWLRLAEIEEPTGIDENAWSRAFVADRIERIMATLSPRRPEKSGVIALRNAALKEAMIWHSRRSLEDFYATGVSFQSPTIHRVPFFATAVKQIVNFASAIPFYDDKLDRALAENQKLVDVLLPTTKTGFQTSVKTGPPILDRVEHEVDISVSQLLGRLPNGDQWVPPIPKGKAVLVVRTQDHVRPISNSSFAVPLQQETVSLSTSLPDLAKAKNLQVGTVFRGHEFRAPLAAQRGVTVEFEPKNYDHSDVVLFADRTARPATVLILDCSWSMGEQIPIEAIDSPTQSRLDAAKSSILRILSQFAEQPESRVGIRLFGHRLGWSRPGANGKSDGNTKTQLLLQPNYAGKIPDDLVPSRDVEAILPLGRFDASMIGPVAERLSSVVPWGQSPLYHAITEAFGDFANDPENNSKCIVVITDGDNFQFAASNRPGGEPASQTNLADVERAWTRSKVPVFVLGVGIGESDGKDIRQNLERLTSNTGGKYYDVQDGADLVRALSERLSVGKFRVAAESKTIRQTPSGSQLAFESQFNRPVELPVQPRGNNAFEIEFRSVKKTFQVEGGESLEMQLLPSGEDIVSIPYERNSQRAGTLIRGNSPGSIIARAHRPQMLSDGVLFPVSFQDPNSHYTPRPKELWMELTPSPSAEQGTAKYVYYDTPFEPGLPVPMIHWTVGEWPKGSTEADLSVWIKQEVTPAKWTIPISRVIQESQKYSEGMVLDSETASQLRVRIGNRNEGRDVTIQVTEIHDDAQFTSNYRVALDLGDIGKPKRVVRRYEAGGRIAVHSFTLSNDVLQQAQSSPQAQIKISTKEDILRGAWQLQGNAPIRVSIGSQVNTVPREDIAPLQLP